MKTLLNAALGNKQTKVPIWFMRQAGRYLPEYQEYRKKYDTLTMFKTPSIASEITLQPLKRFDLDGAILYADILLIPDALDVGLQFVAGEGPKISNPVRKFEDLKRLKNIYHIEKIIDKLSYVGETMTRVVPLLPNHVTMIGFAGAPFTVASYMIEGESGSKKNFIETKTLIAKEPETFHALMESITNITIAYLQMQIKCGAEVLQIFESWSGALDTRSYEEFCLPYVQQIIQALKTQVPIILYLGTSAHIIDSVINAQVTPNVLSVDHHIKLDFASQKIIKAASTLNSKKIGLQGNLDPAILFASKNEIESNVHRCLQIGREHPYGYIFNLGHGVNQKTPIENISYVVDLIIKTNL